MVLDNTHLFSHSPNCLRIGLRSAGLSVWSIQPDPQAFVDCAPVGRVLGMSTVQLATSEDLRCTIEPFCHLEAGRNYLSLGVLQCSPLLPQREPEIQRVL